MGTVTKINQDREYAARIIDNLIRLDLETTGLYFEMGRLLSSILHGKLWEPLEYTSFTHFVEEELSFSVTTAQKYARCYRDTRRLGYNKTESLALFKKYSYTAVAKYFQSAKAKAGQRAVGNAIAKQKDAEHQINFSLPALQHKQLKQVLVMNGAEEKDGRLMHSSEALCKALSLG